MITIHNPFIQWPSNVTGLQASLDASKRPRLEKKIWDITGEERASIHLFIIGTRVTVVHIWVDHVFSKNLIFTMYSGILEYD